MLPLPANWLVIMRNVIVSGGSRGLGLGIVRRLTAGGYRAFAVARKMNDQLASAMEQAEQSRPGSLHFIQFDLGAIQDIPGLVKQLRKDFGFGRRSSSNA
jgi:3-oxoacyl-[acyl-carrier protein] reductase